MADRIISGLFGQPVQPWDLAIPEDKAAIDEARDRLLAALQASDLGTIESKVAQVLQDFPETRDSDVELAIRYWEHFEPEVIAQWDRLNLDVLHDLQPMTTLVRSRQRIQNDFGLFMGSRRVRDFRSEQQRMFFQYLAEKRREEPEIQFYLDETGTDSATRFVGVGGVCVIDARAYEMRHAALRNWRRSQDWPGTLHFADMDSDSEHRFERLLAQLNRYRAGLLFLGYATVARGGKESLVASLFAHLVCDAVRVLRESGCLNVPRSVRVIKEAAEGFDSLYLEPLQQDLAELLARTYPEQVFLKSIEPIPKGREVLLECADVIAASIRRRWESPKRIHKDRIAEAVMNVTGFEVKPSLSAVFKVHL